MAGLPGVLLIATLAAAAVSPPAPAGAKAETNPVLAARAAAISKGTGGSVGLAVLHIESGQLTSVNGGAALPLYSVFKLPVAITVLREAAAGRIELDGKVHVDPKDALLGGSKENDDRWRRPVDTTVRDLIGFSIVSSDNTAVDKLLELLGGPAAVTRAMTALGFPAVEVKASVHGFRNRKGAHPNVASAADLARLLGALYEGTLVPDPQRALLLGFMNDAVTGLARLRGDLPPGTRVADKTGTGPATCNDVGIVTLPGGGHLAIAALITGSRRPLAAQEKAIAEIARAAYDAYASPRP